MQEANPVDNDILPDPSSKSHGTRERGEEELVTPEENRGGATTTTTTTTTTTHSSSSFQSELNDLGPLLFDLKHVIHPTTYVHYPVSDEEKKPYLLPLVKSAKGAYLTLEMPDVVPGENDGGRMKGDEDSDFDNSKIIQVLDGDSSVWCTSHGYRNEHITQAMVRQLEDSLAHVMFESLTHEAAVKLTAMLLDLAPKPTLPTTPVASAGLKEEEEPAVHEDLKRFTKVYYADSGSYAVETAMKLAVEYQHYKDSPRTIDPVAKRVKFVTLRKEYHGGTAGAMSLAELHDPRRMFLKHMLPEQYHVKEPECRENGCEREGKCVCDGLKELVSLLDSRALKEIAGVIVEPIYQGGEGFRLYSPLFLRGVREACTKHDVVLIVDEISAGLGRLGVMWASELAGIMPDIITVGKSLTGGHAPLSAAIMSERLARVMDWKTPNIRGPTYSACAVSCAAAIATMELLKTTPWQERTRRIEAIMKRKLVPFAEANKDMVKDVRVLGATVAIEMKNACDAAIARKVKFRALRKWKCLVEPQIAVLPLAPPFNAPLTDEEVERLADCMMDLVGFIREIGLASPRGVLEGIKFLVTGKADV